MALNIWEIILCRNQSLFYAYILSSLPRATKAIFVSTSTSWGIGRFFGHDYFSIPNRNLSRFHHLLRQFNYWKYMEIPAEELPIAHLELLTAMVDVICFSRLFKKLVVRLRSDNNPALSQLQKIRCATGISFQILAMIEFYKRKFGVQISSNHIPGVANTSADSL